MRYTLKILLIFSLSVFLFSCDYTNEVEPEDTDNLNLTTTKSHYKALQNISTTFLLVNYYIKSSSLKNDSVSITIDPDDSTTYPKTITVDFHDGALCYDGITRKGKIILTLTSSWDLNNIEPNTTISVKFDDYYYKSSSDSNFIKQTGNFSISFKEFIGSKPVYVVDAIESKLIFNDDEEIYWNSSHTLLWINGFNNMSNLQDDNWKLTGSSSGTDIEGKTYYTVIQDTLYYSGECNNGEIVKGILKISPESSPARTINFGNGECDNSVTVTVGDNNVSLSI